MEYTKIELIPRIPPAILDAFNRKELAVFIGAGVSRIIGCMGWEDLAKELLYVCHNTFSEDNNRLISFEEQELLRREKDHKKIISICFEILNETNQLDLFYQQLEKALLADETKIERTNIYDLLSKFRSVFFTTNADKHFHKPFLQEHIYYKLKDFSPENIETKRLFHIHGMIDCNQSLVFTISKYFEQYNNPELKTFLEKIFTEYTILFVGYGLAEFELLDYLFTKFGEEEIKLKHFHLKPYFKYEENIVKFDQKYYEKMGINLIPFSKSENGYSQLYYVLKEWQKEITQVTPYLFTSIEEIEDDIDDLSDGNIRKILQTIQIDESLEKIVSHAILNSKSIINWFRILYDRNLFDSKNNPLPEESIDFPGNFSNPPWYVLDILERVSEMNIQLQDEEITEKIVEISEGIIDFEISPSQRNDNFRTDNKIISVLFNLPLNKISKKHVDFIKIALHSRWPNNLIFDVLERKAFPKLLSSDSIEFFLKLVEILFDYTKEMETQGVAHSIAIDRYYIDRLFFSNTQTIARFCGKEIIMLIINNIIKEYKKDFEYFLYVIDFVREIDTYGTLRFKQFFIKFLYQILLYTEPRKLKELVKTLLEDEDELIIKIAILTIDIHYTELKDIFWSLSFNPCDRWYLRNEINNLITNNIKYFTNEELEIILLWIESIDFIYPPEEEKEKKEIEKAITKRKISYLIRLLPTNNIEILQTYDRYQEQVGEEVETEIKPPFRIKIEEETALEENDIFSGKTNNEIAELLVNDSENMTNSLYKFVEKNAHQILEGYEPFLQVPLKYRTDIMWSLNKYWSTEKDFNWEKFLSFSYSIIGEEQFFKTTNIKEIQYTKSLLHAIFNLYYEFLVLLFADEKEKLFGEFFKTIKFLFDFFPKEYSSDKYESSYLQVSISNSLEGKLLENVFIFIELLLKKKNEVIDEKYLEPLLEVLNRKLMENNQFGIALYFNFGLYLKIMHYYRKKWLEEKLGYIFPETDEEWDAAMTGYLSSPFGSEETYELIKQKNIYSKGINTNFKDRTAEEHLVQHLCLSIFNKFEKLDQENCLLNQLLDIGKKEHLSEIVRFVFSLRNIEIENRNEIILMLWQKIYAKLCSDLQKRDYQEVLFELIKWLVYIEIINEEILEMLITSAKYSEDDSNLSLFVKYLTSFVEESPKEVGEIYLTILDSGVYPTYKEEHIEKILEILFQKGEKEKATRICNRYINEKITIIRNVCERILNSEQS